MTETICFVGAGNMARSIIGGLVAEGYDANSIIACDLNEDTLTSLQNDFGVQTTQDGRHACARAHVVVLSVKPQVLKTVCLDIHDAIPAEALIISIAAGVNESSLSEWLGPNRPIVRCMPNTPSLVKMGAAGLFANPHVSASQKLAAQNILSAVGLVVWLDEEKLIEPVTAISGSGPAYFFFMLEAMVDAGVQLGLDEQSAKTLAIQTAAGAAELAAHSDVDLAELRRRVTSPGGTTEQAIKVFENRDLRAIVLQAMTACADRSLELANILGSGDD